MNTFQIILAAIFILLVMLRIKKMFLSKNITNYNAAQLYEKMKADKNIIFLDVRTDMERKSRSIKGSMHIPLHELKQSIEKINKYKEKEIVCYCQSGSRSVSAAIILNKNGFKAANLIGGIGAWNY